MKAGIVNKITMFRVLVPDGMQWDFAEEVGPVTKEFSQQRRDSVRIDESSEGWIVKVFIPIKNEKRFLDFCENFFKVRGIKFENIFG